MYVYPKLDSAVWTVDEIPPLDHVLAFDQDGGTIAYVDAKGFPGRLDLRETDVAKASRAKLTSLSSANGSDIYGINSKGEIVRLNPTGGDWHFKPPVPARAVFAQPNGELIVTANKGAQTLVWRVRPPDDVVQDSAVLPLSGRGVRTQIGDRIYFAVDSGLVGVKGKGSLAGGRGSAREQSARAGTHSERRQTLRRDRGRQRNLDRRPLLGSRRNGCGASRPADGSPDGRAWPLPPRPISESGFGLGDRDRNEQARRRGADALGNRSSGNHSRWQARAARREGRHLRRSRKARRSIDRRGRSEGFLVLLRLGWIPSAAAGTRSARDVPR